MYNGCVDEFVDLNQVTTKEMWLKHSERITAIILYAQASDR